MAERMASIRSQDQDPKCLSRDSVPSTADRIMLPTCDEIENEYTSDGETTDEATERSRLEKHQRQLRKTLPPVPSWNKNPRSRANVSSRPEIKNQPPRSYAALAAAATVTEVIVGRSGNLRSNPPMGRARPRSLCVHSANGVIDCRAFIRKLADQDLKPTHLQKLPNGDLEVTFASLGDKDRFLGLPFVHHPRQPWTPGLQHPPPVWVRIFHVPAELLPVIVEKRMEQFGRVLFARENIHPDTEIANCVMTLKMVLKDAIPSYVHLGPYCLQVRHEAQPMTCRKCDSRDHFAANCSVKRCYNCGSSGHINADCPETSRCQGCGSPDHHIVQCDASWTSEVNRHTDSSSSSSDDEDDSISIRETPINTTMAYDRALALRQQEVAAEQAPTTQDHHTLDVETPNWYETTELAASNTSTDLVPDSKAATQAPPSSQEETTPLATDSHSLAAPSTSTSAADPTLEANGQAVKNWFDPPTLDGMNSPSTSSSPLLSSQRPVEAGVPAASKRSFQDDNVSDISAVRRPSTKKKPKGRSARQPPLS